MSYPIAQKKSLPLQVRIELAVASLEGKLALPEETVLWFIYTSLIGYCS